MAVEIIEAPSGWPLGLENINSRLTETQNSPSQAAPEPTPAEQSPSPSFSSFSSSDLDTESTASFFPDKSVSLGLLMGIKPGNRRITLQFPNTEEFRQHGSLSSRRSNPELSRTSHSEAETSQGLCVPLLQNVIQKMSRSKSTSSFCRNDYRS